MDRLLENKKAFLNYEIGDKYEAGIELFGFEVKSLKSKLGSLEGAYVIIRGGEAYVINFFIPPFQEKNAPKDYDPRRNRRLLLTKKEIKHLSSSERNNTLTIIPIIVYNKGGKIKIEIAEAKGKKKYDKKETLKKKDVDRQIRSDLRNKI